MQYSYKQKISAMIILFTPGSALSNTWEQVRNKNFNSTESVSLSMDTNICVLLWFWYNPCIILRNFSGKSHFENEVNSTQTILFTFYIESKRTRYSILARFYVWIKC